MVKESDIKDIAPEDVPAGVYARDGRREPVLGEGTAVNWSDRRAAVYGLLPLLHLQQVLHLAAASLFRLFRSLLR